MSSTMNSQKPRSVQNAHDWVWLGKNAVDRGDLEESLSVQTSGSRQTLDVVSTDVDDALGRRCNRLSYGSSTAEINVITIKIMHLKPVLTTGVSHFILIPILSLGLKTKVSQNVFRIKIKNISSYFIQGTISMSLDFTLLRLCHIY